MFSTSGKTKQAEEIDISLDKLQFSVPSIYIIGEENHYSEENLLFKEGLIDLVRSKKNKFYLGLEGQTFPDNFNDSIEINACGIQNKIITFYVDCIKYYICMNPESNHSEDTNSKIKNHVMTGFLRLCQYIPRFFSLGHDQHIILQSIFIKLCSCDRTCNNFFLNMPGEELLSHFDSMKTDWYIQYWIEEYSNYILDDMDQFSHVLKALSLALREYILNSMPHFKDHKALANETISRVFSGKHRFEENAETTELMLLFLVDLKNHDWIKNMLVINSYASSKGMPVVYVVGNGHVQGLKTYFGNRHGDFKIKYLSAQDIGYSPLYFMEDMNNKVSPGLSSKMQEKTHEARLKLFSPVTEQHSDSMGCQNLDSPQKDPKNKPGGPHFRRPGLG